MFSIKLFPDYSTAGQASANDTEFLKELKNIRAVTDASHICFSIINYDRPQITSFHLLTYPANWVFHYLKQGPGAHNPFGETDFRRIVALDWDSFRDHPGGIKFLSDLKRFGIGSNHVSVASLHQNNTCSVLSLSFAFDGDKWPVFLRDNNDIHRFYTERLNQRYQEIYCAAQTGQAQITSRERECLFWVAAGLTDDEIASRIGIGKWTVVSHIKSIKQKLGVRNRAAAVAVGITRKIIRPGISG